MAYVGFDLDETLGRFGILHAYTCFLQPQTVLYQGIWSGVYGTQKMNPPVPLSDSLEEKLNEAFDIFIECLIEKEKNSPSGVLRPGILEIAKRLYALQQTNPQAVKGVCIYSNNGNLSFLQLAGRMIEGLANTPGLFCNYVHWFHPLRRYEIRIGFPGTGNKSTQVLQKIFQMCFPGDPVSVDKLYFFDDVVHQNLYSNLLSHYFQVPAYKFDADHKRFDECFKVAMDTTELGTNTEYLQYISPIGVSSMDDILQFIQNDVSSSQRKMIVPNNSAFQTRFQQVFPKPTVSKTAFTKALQTFRSLEKRLNEGATLTNQEQSVYNQAKTVLTDYENQHPNTAGGKRSGQKIKKTRKYRR